MYRGPLRILAGCVAAAACMSLVGCTDRVSGTSSYQPSVGAKNYTLVKVNQLWSLLLGPDEVSGVMKADFTISVKYINVDFSAGIKELDRRCVGAMLAGAEPMYRGSNYGGVAGFGMTGPDDRLVDQAAVAFPDAAAAAEFVNTRVAQWHECANKVLMLHPPDKPEAAFVSPGPTTAYGVGVFPRTQEGTDFGCSHGLAARSNVVADVLACSPDQDPLNDQVASIVNKMLGTIQR